MPGADISGAGPCGLACLVVLLLDVESWKEALPPPTRMQDQGLGMSWPLAGKGLLGGRFP